MIIPDEITCLLDSNKKFSSAKILSCSKRKDQTYDYIVSKTDFAHDSRTLFDRIKLIINGFTEERYCKGCGLLSKSNRESFNTYCSKKCTKGFIKHSSPMSEETKRKRKDTMLKKYGVEYNSQRKDVKQLIGNHFTDPTFIKENIERLKKHSGIHYDLLDADYLREQLDSGKTMLSLCEEINCSQIFLQKYLNEKGIFLNDYNCTQPELIIRNIISEMGIKDVKYNDRSLKKEIDIYLPTHKFGIEANGVYWHSVDPSDLKCSDVNRHLYKTRLCEDNGIRLLQFWDLEIVNKSDIVRSIIRMELGFYDRHISSDSCIVKDVNQDYGIDFMIENQLSDVPSNSRYKGLFCGEELVSALSFSENECEIEIFQICSKINYKVEGFFELLIESFLNKTIKIRLDKRYCDSSFYTNRGFTLIEETSPDYKRLTKYGLEDKLEHTNDGNRRVYDCGSIILTK